MKGELNVVLGQKDIGSFPLDKEGNHPMFGPLGLFGQGDIFVEAIFKNFKYVFHYQDKDDAFFEPKFVSTLGKLHCSLKTVYEAFDPEKKFKEMNGRIFHTFLTTAVTGFQANSANTPHKLAVSFLYSSPFICFFD